MTPEENKFDTGVDQRHSDTIDNEVADMLAKQGIMSLVNDTFSLSARVLKNKIKLLHDSKWQQRWNGEKIYRILGSMLPQILESRFIKDKNQGSG